MATVVRKKIAWNQTKKYDWKTWTDGRTWSARKGKDYQYEDSKFQRALHAYANTHGLKVRTKIEKKGEVIFQFYEGSKK